MDFVASSLETHAFFEEFGLTIGRPRKKLYRVSPKSRRRKANIPDAKSVLNQSVERLIKSGLSGEAYVREYLRFQYLKNRKPNTIKQSARAIEFFLTFLRDNDRECLETLTREDLWAYIEHEQDRGMKPTTVESRIRILKAFARFLIEKDVVRPDLLKKRIRISVPDPLPRAMDPEDERRLLSVLKNPRDRAMILTLLRTGMRIGELLTTKMVDLNLKEKKIEIFEAHKNRTGRVVYLSDDAVAALRAWIRKRDPEEEYLFYSSQRDMLSYETARRIFKKHIEKAGLSHKKYTLHCLRHTFATDMVNADMKLEYLQPIMGHSSIEMTKRYGRITDTKRREEYYKAMSIIEKGGRNGHYRFDHKLS